MKSQFVIDPVVAMKIAMCFFAFAFAPAFAEKKAIVISNFDFAVESPTFQSNDVELPVLRFEQLDEWQVDGLIVRNTGSLIVEDYEADAGASDLFVRGALQGEAFMQACRIRQT